MKKILMCALLAFSLTSINGVQAGNKRALTTKGEAYFSEKTLDELIEIFKGDPMIKKDPKNGKDLIDKTRTILEKYVGKTWKDLLSENPGIHPNLYNYVRALMTNTNK